MTQRTFGLLGHGVVGSLFARLLREREAIVISYDVLLDDAAASDEMRRRILAGGARPASLKDAVCESDFVLAVTPTQACRGAALQARRYLRAGQKYCDFASTSPAAKRELAAIVEPTGAHFVEGAILGAVGSSGTCPYILIGGPGGAAAAEMLQAHGLRTRFYSPEIGRASAFKMIRSIFSKGMEALLLETLVAARRAGILDEVWEEIKATLAPGRKERTLETWIRSHAVSSERRYSEMLEVSDFLEELHMKPLLASAAAEMFRRSNILGMASAFEREPTRFTEVIDYLEARSGLRLPSDQDAGA